MFVDMCRAVRCKQCGKTTWAGCGMHVDQVMAGVAVADRCEGHSHGEMASARGGLLGFLKR
jgi:hypothetical protein